MTSCCGRRWWGVAPGRRAGRRAGGRDPRTRIRRLLADILEEGRRAGTVRSDLDPETAAAVLFEMGWGVVRAGLEGVTGVPLDVALADLNDIVGRGIRNPKRRGR